MIEEILQKAKKEHKKVYVYAHKFPDGDAISSACAVTQYFKDHGIDATYVLTRNVHSYDTITGTIPVTNSVKEHSISILLDTSTVSYAENKQFISSYPCDIYIIDHHEKAKDAMCMEDELKIPSSHVIRNATASSTCEILAKEFRKEDITPSIATLLTLGLLTDTAKLKFIKEHTLSNLAFLMESGADYETAIQLCNRKSNVKDEVGLANLLLKTQKFSIGNTFGLINLCNYAQVISLAKQYGIRNLQKKIFKMTDIQNCSFVCMGAENKQNQYDLEFRSTSTCGNFNVLPLASQWGGGGHYHASGTCIKSANRSTLIPSIQEKVSHLYTEPANQFSSIKPNTYDISLAHILKQTNHFTTNISPEILLQADSLIKQGANYESTFKTLKSLSTFMIENELLHRLPHHNLFDPCPVVSLHLSPQDMTYLMKRYHVTEHHLLDFISMFTNMNVQTATITLPNGKHSQMDKTGTIHRDFRPKENTFIVR